SAVHVGRCVPIYRKLGQFQTKKLREITYSLLEHVEKGSFVDIIPEEIISRRSLCRYFEALRQMHFPSESSNMNLYEVFRSPAQMRLIYEEFFWMALLYGFKKSERNREEKLVKIEISNQTLARVKKVLPFTLTGAQRSVFKQISADMRSDIPMNRLVQGDVGSGKTIIAFLAMYLAIENGYQAALMAPTEILAEQHFANAKEFFGKLNLETDILTGSLRVGEKRKVKARIASGASNAIIGTHALIQDDVNFCALGLAVIDEQHRFGVLQRAQLRESGLNPEVIVMTATPIPRSLAISVYGDLDYSVIDELPPGRTPVKTVVVGEDKRTGVYKGISREVATGRQVYIVYPLIKESEKMDLKAATEMYDDLRTQIFPELRIALLHGKLKAEEKEDIMRRFTRGEVDILVSTTVIEVGVDVPNATLMVIEHAERFGLSQLHQLRGRVGRGSEESFCVLLTADKKSETARQRLGIMEKTSNGFEVAEKDLEIRGQGELLGTRQSGKRAFKLANIVRDKQILEEVQEDVTNMFKESGKSEEVEQLLRIVECDPRMNFLDFA
ncbi:MAG: ATP-dependent DNA helicase RecG, partial [Pyrinomonadaceae bacterium]